MTQPHTSPERGFWFIDEHSSHRPRDIGHIAIRPSTLERMDTYLHGTNESNRPLKQPEEIVELPPVEEK